MINWCVRLKLYTAISEVPRELKSSLIMKSGSLGLFDLNIAGGDQKKNILSTKFKKARVQIYLKKS